MECIANGRSGFRIANEIDLFLVDEEIEVSGEFELSDIEVCLFVEALRRDDEVCWDLQLHVNGIFDRFRWESELDVSDRGLYDCTSARQTNHYCFLLLLDLELVH